MKVFAIRFSFVLVFFVLSCCFSPVLRAQLQEVGSLEGYSLYQAKRLNNAVLLSNNASFSARENFLTNNFQDYYPAPAPAFMRGHLNLGSSYLIARDTATANTHYLLKVNNNLTLDTVVSFFAPSEGTFEPLSTRNEYGYFGLDTAFFRFNENTQTITRINIGFLKTQSIHFRFPQFAHKPDAFYFIDDHVYRLAPDDTVFTKGLNVENERYPELHFHPQIKTNQGVLFSFVNPADSAFYTAVLVGDTTVNHINPLPLWPDTSFKFLPDPEKPFISFWRNYGSTNQASSQFVSARRFKVTDNGNGIVQIRWYFFDTLTNTFSITQDIHNFKETEGNPNTFKLKNGTLAFAMYRNKGLELVRLHKDSIELLRDNFSGMISGGESLTHNANTVQLDGHLFYMAMHPYYGYCLHRTNGTKEGTGVIAKFNRLYGRTTLFKINQELFAYAGALDSRAIFKIDTERPFLSEKYNQNTTKHWNNNIYSSLYGALNYTWVFDGYNPMQYKKGLVLTSSANGRIFNWHHPEEGSTTPRFSFNKSFQYSLSYGIYDTTGRLLYPGYVQSFMALTRLALGKDSTLHIFYRHSDTSSTNFDAESARGERNFIKTYSLKNGLKWSLEFDDNFEVDHMITDSLGDLYLVGSYTGGFIRLSNIDLSSKSDKQYFAAKLNETGTFLWAKNLNMAGFTNEWDIKSKINLDEGQKSLYILVSEGDFYEFRPPCGDGEYLTKVFELSLSDGQQAWESKITTTDYSHYTDIVSTDWGEIWLAGSFRGDLVLDQKAIQTTERCSINGLLVVLDKASGRYKKSFTNSIGTYAALSTTNKALFTVWYSEKRNIPTTLSFNLSKFYSLSIEKRDYSGLVSATYTSPFAIGGANYQFDLKVLDNGNDDFIFNSRTIRGRLVSDSLYVPNVSLEENKGSSLLMRRSGQIFKDLELAQPLANPAGNPFSIYPNPSLFPEVFVRAAGSEKPFTRYQLSGLDGRVVASGSLKEESFPQYLSFPSHLRGMFILNLSGNGKPQSFKLMLE